MENAVFSDSHNGDTLVSVLVPRNDLCTLYATRVDSASAPQDDVSNVPFHVLMEHTDLNKHGLFNLSGQSRQVLPLYYGVVQIELPLSRLIQMAAFSPPDPQMELRCCYIELLAAARDGLDLLSGWDLFEGEYFVVSDCRHALVRTVNTLYVEVTYAITRGAGCNASIKRLVVPLAPSLVDYLKRLSAGLVGR